MVNKILLILFLLIKMLNDLFIKIIMCIPYRLRNSINIELSQPEYNSEQYLNSLQYLINKN